MRLLLLTLLTAFGLLTAASAQDGYTWSDGPVVDVEVEIEPEPAVGEAITVQTAPRRSIRDEYYDWSNNAPRRNIVAQSTPMADPAVRGVVRVEDEVTRADRLADQRMYDDMDRGVVLGASDPYWSRTRGVHHVATGARGCACPTAKCPGTRCPRCPAVRGVASKCAPARAVAAPVAKCAPVARRVAAPAAVAPCPTAKCGKCPKCPRGCKKQRCPRC